MTEDKKILIIPDLHGKDIWKKAILENKWDLVVFLGDYLDAWPEDATDSQIVKNFRDIIAFKKDNPDTVILLLGNHEDSYLDFSVRCSGFRPSISLILNQLLLENRDLFQIAYQIEKNDKALLFTHAGVSNEFYESIKEDLDPDLTLSENLNQLYNSSKVNKIRTVGRSSGGRNKFGGPLWARDHEFSSNNIPIGYAQYVGHTPMGYSKTALSKVDENSCVVFLDVLDYTEYFLVV